jgi:hypothetical protein
MRNRNLRVRRLSKGTRRLKAVFMVKRRSIESRLEICSEK